MAEEKDKFTFEKNVSKKSGGAKNGQYNSWLVPLNGRENDWQRGGGAAWLFMFKQIKVLEASTEYRSLAADVALWAQSGAQFLNEYKDAYAAMDEFITKFFREINPSRWMGTLPAVSVIPTSGLLAYKSGFTIEQVMADKLNYNNHPACSAAVDTFNGNVCIAKYGHYTQEEKKIIEAGYNIGVDVKAVKELQSKSRDSGRIDFADFLIQTTNNIAKTMTGGDVVIFDGQGNDFLVAGPGKVIWTVFTTMVSQSIPIEGAG